MTPSARRAIFFAASLVCVFPLGAQRAPARAATVAEEISAPISDIRYDVTFDATTAPKRTIKVAMHFIVTGAGPVLLSLPAWTPGAYEIDNFARWVSNFDAQSGGKPLSWDKLDFDTWRVRSVGAKDVTVSFDYRADSLDNAIAWSREQFALFNGTNIFMYAEGRPLTFASTVTVKTDPNWLIATGMTAGAQPHTYTSTNFHDLVDMPFFVGRFDLDSAQVDGRWARLATWPAGTMTGQPRATFWEQYKKVFPAMAKVFGETPFANYTTMIVFDSASGGGSALEHQSSHLGIYTPLLVGNLLLPSITAHEMFHSYNVKRLRPADMTPYRYDRAMPTPWLWVSEGITDYYSDLVLVRSGITDSAGFLKLTQGKMDEVTDAPPVALTDASLSTWIHPTDGTGYIYYQKGSLAGFMLDIMIRDASDNKRSLDDVMRELYETTFKKGRGFTAEDWWGAVSRAANGKSFADFNARYIDGRDPFPWTTVLALGGFAVKVDSIREPRLGVTTAFDSLGVRVVELEPEGAAQAAGVKSGDYLMAVGDVPVTDPSFGQSFRSRYARGETGPIPLKVRRGTETVTLQITPKLVTRTAQQLVSDPKATGKAAKVRSGILKGETDK